ncbi:MAG: YicC/YloC family endoribonuclease [Eubacterium sp.]
MGLVNRKVSTCQMGDDLTVDIFDDGTRCRKNGGQIVMKSMTGFGRKDYRDEEVEISVEIKTINHRFRDFFLKLPRALNPVEEKIRKAISEKIVRGRIEVFIKYNELGVKNKRIVYNKALAKNYIEILNALKTLDPMINDNLDLNLIAKFPDVVCLEDENEDYEQIWQKLEPILKDALDQVNASRTREGSALHKDIATRCETIEKTVSGIAQKSPEMISKYQADLRAKILDYAEPLEIDEKRILTEVAIMADKLAIDEELTRLNSHTNRLKGILEETDEAVGRKLDFLVQELNREINTIGSKANDIEISNLVVDVKSEIEKIREQVQNIE